MKLSRPAWIEVDLNAIAHNMKQIRNIVKPETEIMAVVKANGYGHGAEQVTRTVLKYGATRLGVATLSEAIELREKGIGVPILVLGYNPAEHAKTAIEYDVTQSIYTIEMAEACAKAAEKMGKQAVVHLKIDTGMGRIGFLPGLDTIRGIKKIVNMPWLFVEGIFTHFAVADCLDKTFTWQQFENFQEILKELEKEGIEIPLKHAANSAAVIDLPQTHLNLVRPGIIIYGLYPSREVDISKINLRPAMALKAQVAFVKKVAPGTSISYGRRFIAEKEAVIATLPLGYADGFGRMLSNRAEILLQGKRVRVVGTVCMDQLMVDVSEVPDTRIGDEAVIFGNQGEEQISVEEIAERLNTINYEIICMLSLRVPRLYIKGTGKERPNV
ncbi:MAG: alanine racemase [Desulfitobacteriaceae bacterium]|nr:alanine racemase [Desulfitobacteriaceae bacterium]MDD4753628.1 alanine racemase [Desulfitobacteriaceae bacterium]